MATRLVLLIACPAVGEESIRGLWERLLKPLCIISRRWVSGKGLAVSNRFLTLLKLKWRDGLGDEAAAPD